MEDWSVRSGGSGRWGGCFGRLARADAGHLVLESSPEHGRGRSVGRWANTGDQMTAIHPGEHLAEELKVLGMSAASLARQLAVPTNRVNRDPKRPAYHHGRYSSTSRPLLRNKCGVLAEPSKSLRTTPGRAEGR